MADQPLFDGAGAPTETGAPVVQSTPPATQPDPALLEILVGEGRKYKDVTALVKGHIHADEHISRLEVENKTLREEATRIAASQPAPADQPTATSGTPPTVTAAAIAEMVKNAVTGLETDKIKRANRHKALQGLQDLFGAKAQETFERETPDVQRVLTQLAEVDPDKMVAFFRPAVSPTPTPTSGRSTVNTGASVPNSGRATEPGTREYYERLRKTDPKKYWSSALQTEKIAAAERDPRKFFGR